MTLGGEEHIRLPFLIIFAETKAGACLVYLDVR